MFVDTNTRAVFFLRGPTYNVGYSHVRQDDFNDFLLNHFEKSQD